MKKQNMSFTELGETKSQAEDGVGNGDDDAGAQTEEDSEFQQNENKEAMEQLTLSKDQMASDFKVETGVTEKDTLGTQDGAEEYTSPAQVISDNDSELEDSGAMDQLQQENSHPEDDQEGDDQEEDIQEEVDQEEDDQEEDVQEEVDQEEVFVDDSTFNNDSLFAIPAEDIPVEGAERSQTENVDQEEAFIDDSTFNNDSLFAIPAEDIPVQGAAENQTQNAEENVVENLAENENTNAADQLNEQPIDVMNALLPSEAQEYYEDTIENINESSLMLRRDMNEIRSRTPTLGGFYQRTSLRETEPSNLSGIFAPGLQLSSDTSFARANASLVPADTSDSFTFDYSAIQRELEANNTIEGTSGLSPIQENEDGEADSQAGYEDMLPDYLTADSNFNTSQRPNNSSLIASSPMSESAIARAISFFGEDSVLEDSRVENNVGWDDQSLVEKSGEFDEEPSQDKSANETEDGQKSDESPEEDQDSPQSDVQNEGSLSSAGYSKENVQEQEHDGDDDEDTTIRGLKQDNEAGDIEDTIRDPKEKNEVEGDEHTITGPEEDDNITIGFSNAVVESLTTSQESIFTDGPPKGSFSTNSGSFESKSSSMDQAMGSPANVARKAANKDVDSLFDTSMTVSTPEVNRTHKFSLPPRFTPSSASKRSLADSPSKKGTPNALNMSPYGMRPEDIPDFDDDFSVIESTPSDRKTPATEQKWITPAGSNTPHHLFSSPSKPKSLLSKLLQEENFEFTDDFSFIEDEKEGANKGEDEADRGENNEKIRSQPGESPGRTSPEAPLGEVQIYAGPITPTHAAGVADAPTGKRKIGTLEPVSVKRGKHVSASSRPIAIEVGDDMNEDISLIDVEDVIGDRKYIRPKGRRQSLRLSYLDSAASNTVCEPEPQSEVYLTPEKSRFQNLNPLFSACPDSVQAKRRGRRTSIGQRRASLELEENAHVYTTMQAAVRGYICRKKLKEAHERANEIPGEISDLGDVTTDKATVQRDLEMAAVVFVSAWKGLKQRRAYLIQRAAAVTIQRAYRKRQAAVSQSAKSAMSVPEDKTEEPATPIPAGPFDGLLKRFDNKKAAETAAISEPESCLPVTQPVVHRHTPRPRRMATHSPVPEKYLYRDPNKYKRAISVEPELKAVAEPPTTSADDDVESKERPTRASGSRIPRSGLRLPVASGMSSTSIGKRKAEDDINEPFVPKFKLTTAQAAAPTPHRTTRVVPGNISLIPGSNPFGNRMIKDSLSKMTQPEVNQLTTRYTARNRRYDIDFERKVVRVERDRSSSPDAKTQHRRALEDRKKRYEVEEETGIVLGPGDPMDYEPEIKTPTRKGVRWHTDLEFGWDEDLEKNSPSAAKKKAKEGFNGIVRKQVPLDPFGNVVGPRPRINETPEKIVISKVLYIGEDDE
ncbi:hypothetical protein BGX38DRAFT_655176 [Terfezia claveryi]|nr:hypothetical protein BGX38DRAFT_655176 [Terfezia claveryi]